MKSIKKVISIFLAILTLFSICSTSTTVLAAEYTEQKARTEYFDLALSGYLKNIIDTEDAVGISEKEQVDEVVEEVNSSVTRTASTFSLRATPAQSTETAKEAAEDLDIDHTRLTLELEGGENVAYLFSEPVSFIDDAGNLVYKDTNIKAVTDTTIINRGYSFENGNNDYKAYFSEDSSKGLLLVEKDGEEIRLVPNGIQSVGTVGQIESDMELVDSFEYAGVYGTDSVLRFLPQLNGCKEEIVLSSYQGISDFSFTLYTQEGTIAAINSKGEVEIIDSATKDIITTFVAPFANDSSGGMDVTSEHYTDCTYELEMISESKYTLTISVPEEYLESENTVYPVVIDPTTDNISMTYDTSVYSALKDSPQSSNPSACFGKTGSSEYGQGRAMFYFKIPSDIEKYAKISAAKLWLREVTGRTDTMYVRPYLIKESWNNSVTWSTQPAYYSTCSYPTKSDLSLPRRNINSASTDDEDVPYWYAFNIIYAVKAWTTGTTNRGLMFIAECEASDGDYLWRGFATKEYTTSSYRPYAVIKYTNDVTPPEITDVVKDPDDTYTNKNVTVTVTATDNVYKEGGISKYSFDNGKTWQTSEKKTYKEEGTYTPKVIVKDLVSLESDTWTVSKFIIDKTAPEITSVKKSITSEWANSNVKVTINASDKLSGMNSKGYYFDSSKGWQADNYKTYSAEGTYTVTPKARDKVPNTATESNVSVKIDKTAPVVKTPTKNPSSEWSNTNVTVTNNATDALSGIASSKGYSFDNGSSWQNEKTKTYSTEGTYTVTPKAKDKATNEGTGSAISVKIDKTAPVVKLPTKNPSTEWSNTNVTVTNNATDALSGIASSKGYSFDNGSSWQDGKTKTYSTEGVYTVTPKAKDKATNVGTGSAISVKIDKTAPTISKLEKQPSAEWSKDNVNVTVTATDALSGIATSSGYSFNNGTDWQTNNYKTYSAEGTYTVTSIVKDKATNKSASKTTTVKIDKTAPTATVTGTVNGSTVDVTVAASDALSGLHATAYSFDGGTNWQSSNTKKSLSANTTHTIVIRDKADNRTTIKYNPKIGSVTVSPSLDAWTNGKVTLTASGTNISQYKFDSGSWSATEKSKSYSTNITAKVGFKDSSGNITYINVPITNIDSEKPVITSVNLLPESGWANQNVTATVNASDTGGSGIYAYSADNGNSWQDSNVFTFSELTEAKFLVKDNAGNSSEVLSKEILIDKDAPTLDLTGGCDDWSNEPITVVADANDAGGSSIFGYSFDGGNAWVTDNRKVYEESTNEIVSVAVKDNAGNITEKTAQVMVDIDTPVISDVALSSTSWTKENVIITVTASDVMSGLADTAYSFDGGTTWQEDNTYTASENGTFNIIVKDKAGNETTWDEIVIDYIDKEVPSSPDLYEQDGLVYISSRSFDFNKDTDSAEYVEYCLDGINWSSYEEPLNIVRTYGATVYARVVDAAHNGEDGSNVTSITLENNLGEYTASYTDIALGEGLFPVEFGRTYTSTNGWFFTFDANVAEIDDNAYVFTDFYGEKQYFIKNSKGQYFSVDEEELTIVESTDEETGNKIKNYRLNYGDMIVELGNNCKLSRITTDYTTTEYKWNADGSLTIDGGAVVNFDKNFRPTSIVITRKENKDGVITDKTKTVVFTWENDKLMKFTDAMNGEHAYGYDEETGLLITNDTETISYSNGRVRLISQPNGAFVKYTYNDNAENAEAPNNVGAVTVSDSKGVTDTIYYADGVYVSSSIDSYSDKAVYAPGEISAGITTDAISNIVYVVESEPQSEEQGTGEPSTGDELESDGENATDNEAEGEINGEENDAEQGEDNNAPSAPELPLYEAINENTYVFYDYDEQNRVATELTVLKSRIADITTATFEDAEKVVKAETVYVYASETDNTITDKYVFTYTDDVKLQTEELYQPINNVLFCVSKFTYDSNENIVLEQYFRPGTENETPIEYENCTRVYEGENLLSETQQTLVDGELTTTKKLLYEYYEGGNIKTETQQTLVDGVLTTTKKLSYEYYENESIKTETQQTLVDGVLTDTKQLAYEYDIGDQLTSYTVKEYTLGALRTVSKESYNYNSFGNLEKEIIEEYTYVLNSNTNEYEEVLNTIETTYAYDIWNQQINITVKKTGEADLTTVITYDELGNTSTVTEDGVAVAYTYSNGNVSTITETKELQQENGTKVTKTVTSVYGYTDGNLVSRTNTTKVDEVVTETTVATYKYDDYGNLAYHEFNGYAFTYNTLGNILTAKAAVKEENGIETSVDIVSYTYSPDIKQDVEFSSFGNNQIIDYDYNADGEITAIKLGTDVKYDYKYSSEEETTSEGETSNETEDPLTKNLEGEWVKINDKVSGLFKVIQENKTSVYDSDKAFVYSVETSSKDADDANSFDGTVTTIGGNVYTLVTEENEDTFKTNDIVDFSKKYVYNEEESELERTLTSNVFYTDYGYGNDGVKFLENVFEKNNDGEITEGYIFNYGYKNENISSESLTVKSKAENGTSVTVDEAVNYEYDDNDQLTKATSGTTEWTYVYDGRGNIIEKRIDDLSDTAGPVTYTYNYDGKWQDRLISYNGQEIKYALEDGTTDNSNPLVYRGNALTWTMGRQLASFGNVSYTYNEDGIRTSKTSNGVTTKFLLDGYNVIEQTDGTTTLHFFYGSNGEVIGFRYNGNDYFYVKNAMGDIAAVTDSDKNIVAEYRYDPWGKVIDEENLTAIGTLNPFRYRSYYYDSDIKMYYLQSRYYDVEVGRFINCDDVNYIGVTESEVSYNPFAYCENNVTNGCDPTGFITYMFYYNKKGKDFKKQANWMKNEYFKKKEVKLIGLKDWSEFVNEWNKLRKKTVDDVFLFLHGIPGSLSFNGRQIYVKDMKSLKAIKKVKGKIYLLSCNGGTTPQKGTSVASFFAVLQGGIRVRAVVNGKVYYRDWDQLFDRKPLTKEEQAYWADFIYQYVNRERKKVVCIVNRRGEWYYG